MNKEANKKNGSQFRARMSENQTKQAQVFLTTNRVNQPWCKIENDEWIKLEPKRDSNTSRKQSSSTIHNQSTTNMCGLYYPHPSNTIFTSKEIKEDEKEEKAYEDDEDDL